jgi:radical SAM protein (TIGR01212 family)
MSYPWGHDRRYNAFSEYMRTRYGERIQKVTIDAGFTCPNRDGATGRGGCTYCDNDSFNPSYCHPEKSITQQLKEGIEFHDRRYRRANRYLAYFQPHSNTYAPLEVLEHKYSEALAYPGVTGLVIGTRPDCMEEATLGYLAELSEKHIIIVEYGIESCYDNTLQRVNRGHTFAQTVEAITRTTDKGIMTGAHMLFGLPGETREEMLAEAEIISGLPLKTVKFHQLLLVKKTQMARDFTVHPEWFRPFSLEEYVDFIIDFIEHLDPGIMIERFASEVPPRFLVGPGWGLIRYDRVLGLIEKRLAVRNTWQGRLR